MKILDGKQVSLARRNEIRSGVAALKARGVEPCLAVILVGDDPASEVYVGGKLKACQEVGIRSIERRLSGSVSEGELRAVIDELNRDRQVHGILLQLPLPKHLNSERAISWISPAKDADCLTPENLGQLWMGKATGKVLVAPCTPSGVMEILKYYEVPVAGRSAVVVGRSNIVGKPMAHLLVEADATVTVCHSKTKNMQSFLRQADLVVVAAGKPEFLGKGDFKTGAVVVDVGIHRKTVNGKTKLCGDVRLKELENEISAGTPVPGGVGPMTITMLMQNTLALASTVGAS